MGVEHISVAVDGNPTPTTGTRVPLGLGVSQKALLKVAYFSAIEFAQGTFTVEQALSQDLRFLRVGAVVVLIDKGPFFAYVRFHQIEATAVGYLNAWRTFEYPLHDFEVYQDIVFIPDVTVSTNRLDLLYEKVTISHLEKAERLRQLARHFPRG